MKNNRLIGLTILAGILISGTCWAKEGALSLSIRVLGADPQTGQVLLSLFSSEESYLKEPFKYREIPVDDAGEVRWNIKGLPAGTYAVSAVYDKNGNGKLDTGLFRIPKELIGMSNDAKGSFGPPSFKQASFLLERSFEITIHLTKVKD